MGKALWGSTPHPTASIFNLTHCLTAHASTLRCHVWGRVHMESEAHVEADVALYLSWHRGFHKQTRSCGSQTWHSMAEYSGRVDACHASRNVRPCRTRSSWIYGLYCQIRQSVRGSVSAPLQLMQEWPDWYGIEEELVSHRKTTKLHNALSKQELWPWTKHCHLKQHMTMGIKGCTKR